MESGSFTSDWEKVNVVSIHKKDDKQCLKNYGLISMPLICGQIFGKFNKMFTFFVENELSSPN